MSDERKPNALSRQDEQNLPTAQNAEPAFSGTALERWRAMSSGVTQLAQVQKALRALIDQHVDAASCYDLIDKTFCRNINYAKTVFRLVGGKFEYLKDDRGVPLVQRINYKDAEGEYYVYEAYGRYTLPTGESVEATGSFSSRDKFFGRVSGEFRPTAEVNERFVRQAALTECFKKAIFTALGYGELSSEEAQRLAIKGNADRSYQHKTGREAGSAAADTKESADDRAVIERLCNDLLQAGFQKKGYDITTAEHVLQAVTANPDKGWDGWRKFKAIKDTQLGRIRHQLEDIVEQLGATDDPSAGTAEQEPLPL